MNTICGVSVDWAATGSMLQGLASLSTIPVLVWAAIKGRQTFEDYSSQKRSEKQIEAAERVLTAAYNARVAIDGVRTPLVEGSEIVAAERQISENGEDLSLVAPERLKRAATTQLFYTRLNAISDEINAVWDALPIGLAYFGEEVHEALREVAHQRRVIQVAADSFLDDDGSDKDFSRSIRRDLYRGFGKAAGGDPISEKVQASIELLESKLLPILRAQKPNKRSH
jgi:hypothetical protein